MTRLIACSLLVSLAGCYAATSEDPASIGAALEEENGGLSMEDEAPAFGMDLELAELELLSADPVLPDPLETDARVLSMRSAPDAVVYRVAIVWGQIPGDRTNDAPHDWSGALGTNRGAMLLRRAIAFEPETDRIIGRPDERSIAFTSVTLPHHDGLVVDIVDPDPASPDPIGLGYSGDLPGELGSESPPLAIPLRALLDGPVELRADADGNRMIAVAQAMPVDVCAHGFVMGRWHRVEEGRGVILGRVVDASGELVGHLRGIYGVRESGEQVFFAKYVGVDGTFRGILRGHYGEGHFEGRWVTRNGDIGGLAGGYRETIEGPETGGHFLGHWGEATCNFPR